ncbi:hypothetical protein IMPR6_160002 [Imperialibacter sp. EC-SDR9]|nr:hypothetical protein IMPERIA89_10441 [Imperialibacter sp. 89]CAD5264961.1 hypothetical protein IMPERIA75_30147 [Imperialibacter sp. 75]VVT06482.1 hypothetical protein IMPR6_160002 [Imperialibacter sp. EC-SDR9]
MRKFGSTNKAIQHKPKTSWGLTCKEIAEGIAVPATLCIFIIGVAICGRQRYLLPIPTLLS